MADSTLQSARARYFQAKHSRRNKQTKNEKTKRCKNKILSTTGAVDILRHGVKSYICCRRRFRSRRWSSRIVVDHRRGIYLQPRLRCISGVPRTTVGPRNRAANGWIPDRRWRRRRPPRKRRRTGHGWKRCRAAVSTSDGQLRYACSTLHTREAKDPREEDPQGQVPIAQSRGHQEHPPVPGVPTYHVGTYTHHVSFIPAAHKRNFSKKLSGGGHETMFRPNCMIFGVRNPPQYSGSQ